MKMEFDTYRALIYYRQSVVCQWLDKGNRVIPCLRHRLPNKETVDVIQRGVRANYIGLQTCGMNWLCPACASKVARNRRKGMKRAIGSMMREGCAIAFVTYTVRHSIDDPLSTVVGWVLKAHRAMHSGKAWKTIEREFGWQGSIRAIEVLYGNNGWHFHIHEIGFVKGGYVQSELAEVQKSRWHKCLVDVGGDADHDIGLQVKPARASIRDYVSKWGIVPELASPQDKKSRRGGMLPFQMPDAILENNNREAALRSLYREYAAGTKGIKQLWASPQIRALMKDDGQPVGDPGDQVAEALAHLSIDQWRAIRRQGLRAELLRAAENGALTEFLMQVKL